MELGARWLLVLLAWAWFAKAVDLGSNAVTHDITDLLVFASWCALACLWALLNITTSVPHRTARSLWLSVPFALGFGAVVYGSEWPVSFRVWLCEAELREYAEREAAERPSVESPHRVGLYTVHEVDRYSGVVDLMTRHDGFDKGGITYAPNGLPPRPTNNSVIDDDYRTGSYRHMCGPWYRRVIRD